jgi:3-oxoacyl-[acyl-carrier-protein] synthase-1
VVLAADSLIEAHTLQWLFDHSRLKCSSNPVGLSPGEAAVAVVLEPRSKALARKTPVLAVVRGVQTAADERTGFTDDPPIGTGLANAVAVLHDALPDGIRTRWVLSDHNGEVHRATDWGYALTRLVGQIEALRQPEVAYPAAAFGDTGASSAGVALCMAVQSFERAYACSREGLVVTSADDGKRAALSFSRE